MKPIRSKFSDRRNTVSVVLILVLSLSALTGCEQSSDEKSKPKNSWDEMRWDESEWGAVETQSRRVSIA